MHTARLLTVSPGMHCAGGSLPGGVCLARGSALPGGGVCLARGVSLQGGVSALPRVLLAGGVVSQHALRQTHPL